MKAIEKIDVEGDFRIVRVHVELRVLANSVFDHKGVVMIQRLPAFKGQGLA